MSLLFVYGTLRRGFPHRMAEFLQKNAKFIGQGFAMGRLYDMGSYPAMIKTYNPDEQICGDVFDISLNQEEILKFLDQYEGISYPPDKENLFIRELVKIQCKGSTFDAYAYIYPGRLDDEVLITSGDYMEYSGIKNN
ncbi:MAG TPA: gamma-glutamylcyclotransferase [Saprospiraceae bacterium]|nr:gamma-glutamylcyclotransferase [Saprospiraceae bacterium]